MEGLTVYAVGSFSCYELRCSASSVHWIEGKEPGVASCWRKTADK